MSVVRCSVNDCANKGKECCTANRIDLDSDGCCRSYLPYEKIMKRNKEINADKCKGRY